MSSGWKPVPTSSRLLTRPRISMRPVVGSVIRARIESSVDLPAPFGPMTPSTSPRRTSNETSRSAQMSSRRGGSRSLRGRVNEMLDPVAEARRPRVRPDAVALPEVAGGDDDGLRHRRRASVRLARTARLRRRSTMAVTTSDATNRPCGAGVPSSAQRKARISPTSGFARLDERLPRMTGRLELVRDRAEEEPEL